MTVILPGAQSLVTAILADGWTRVRTALARRWSRETREPQAAIEERLDAAHAQAAEITSGDADGDQALLRAYWAGYLAAVLAERPALLGLVRDLRSAVADPGAHDGPSVHNTNSGTVTTLIQGGDFSGNITFGTQ
ncbi:hypothetical protein AB0C96_02775 [Streptomyces sp. NPDC048506]|uniref:hypothetical protein n=1 Tax=Streptomyces sp. NPDC048506 TaxID=3155028 RepID=UPI0034464C64